MVGRLAAALLLPALFAAASHAGVYALTSEGTAPTFAIVHPPGFDGSGGVLAVGVCTADATLIGTIQEVLPIWNALSPQTSNCSMCKRAEDIAADAPFGQDLASVILHEIGHALGLDHTNLELVGAQTSSTNGFRTTSVNIGADNVRGSSDDIHFPVPPDSSPASIIHWFRRADNNPIVVDGLVIDDSTFTRTRGFLPPGHNWPASANSDYRAPGDDVADLLGVPNTQAVMYSFQNEQLVYSGISADDANTVRFGMTGLDKLASTSADNYTIDLTFSADCSTADIEVLFVDPFSDADLNPGVLAVTVFRLNEIPEPPAQTQHFAIQPALTETRVLIKINDNLTWDIRGGVFADGFESGDVSDWSDVIF